MNSDSNKEYSVNWKNHMDHVRKAFDDLLSTSELVDVTLCCEGKKIGAHKLLLSACSGYFRDIFKEVPCQHPVIFLKGVEYMVLADILHFIYNGEVSVDTTNLDSFLKTAQLLQISGLTDSDNEKLTTHSEQNNSSRHDSQTFEGIVNNKVTANSSNNVAPSRVNKRTRDPREIEQLPEKISREEDNVYLTDVKTEPTEMLNFDENMEDPLQSDMQSSNDNKDFFDPTSTQGIPEEEFKSEYYSMPMDDNSADIANMQKENGYNKAIRRGRNICFNNYKYLIDKKDFGAKKFYWRCRNYKIKQCTGRLITDLDYNVIRTSVSHLYNCVD